MSSPTTPPTTQPGTVITIQPGQAPHIIGPHNDSSDFFAIVFALAAILVAIVVVRLAFRGRTDPTRLPEERRPGAPPDDRHPSRAGDGPDPA